MSENTTQGKGQPIEERRICESCGIEADLFWNEDMASWFCADCNDAEWEEEQAGRLPRIPLPERRKVAFWVNTYYGTQRGTGRGQIRAKGPKIQRTQGYDFNASVVLNHRAAAVWLAKEFAVHNLGIDLDMTPERGTLEILNHREVRDGHWAWEVRITYAD